MAHPHCTGIAEMASHQHFCWWEIGKLEQLGGGGGGGIPLSALTSLATCHSRTFELLRSPFSVLRIPFKQLKLLCGCSHMDLMQTLLVVSQEARQRPHCVHRVPCVHMAIISLPTPQPVPPTSLPLHVQAAVMCRGCN